MTGNDSDWYNVLRLYSRGIEDGVGGSKYGSRIPSFTMLPNSTTLSVESALNGNPYHRTFIKNNLLNQFIRFEVTQRYVSGGNYRFSVVVDGDIFFTLINTDARQFYDVKVYASNPWVPSPKDVYISNLEITNFL